MEKYNNKYRIPSARRPNWDYSSAGAYFITICTQNREHYFDKIADGKMRFSNIGIIAGILWTQIPFHNNNVELGAFVVMPNHIHGILMIGSLSSPGGDSAKISPKSNSISAIIRSYKSAVTKYAHRYGLNFNGRTVFMTTSSAMIDRSRIYRVISLTTLAIGRRINFLNHNANDAL